MSISRRRDGIGAIDCISFLTELLRRHALLAWVHALIFCGLNQGPHGVTVHGMEILRHSRQELVGEMSCVGEVALARVRHIARSCVGEIALKKNRHIARAYVGEVAHAGVRHIARSCLGEVRSRGIGTWRGRVSEKSRPRRIETSRVGGVDLAAMC